MADEIGTKVSQLPLGENLADSDLMYAVEGGISKKVEVGYLKNRFVGDLTLADLGDDSTHRLVTDVEKTTWNGKSDFSGSYNDLTDKPTIPTVEANPSGEATDELDKIQIGSTIYDIVGGGGSEPVYGEASGAIASFSDGSNNPLVKLEADINPIQDLHGYDKPWAAGAGKNKLPSSNAINTTLNGITFKTSGDGIYEVSGTATAGTNCEFTFSQAVSLVAGKKLSFFNNFTGYNLFFRKDGSDKTYYNFSSANRTVTIAAADAAEFDTLRITVESGATINGKFALMMYEGDTTTTYEPYSNICPISGRSSVEVTAAGKNLYSDVFADYTMPSDYRICPIPLEIGKRYTASAKLIGTAVSGCVIGLAKKGDRYSDFGSFITLVNSSGNVYTNTITLDSSWTSPKLIVYAANETTFNSLFENYEIQLEVGSTATSYEPYNADTETISLGQEVYGGELDVTDGVIRPYKYYASYNSETLVGRWISSLDEYEEGATPTTGAQVVDFGAFDSDIIIIPTTISSRNGVNNIWADSGNSDVVYIRDLNLFLTQLDARVKALENA